MKPEEIDSPILFALDRIVSPESFLLTSLIPCPYQKPHAGWHDAAAIITLT